MTALSRRFIMAIRYTPEYNKRITNIVRNYNRAVIKSNKSDKIRKDKLPETVSVKMLKKSYTRKADLERELRTLERFSRESAKTSYAIGISNYDIQTIRANKRATIKYFENISNIIKSKDLQNRPSEQARLKTIEKNLKILRKSTTSATEDELEAMSAYVDKYRKSFERQATGYRGFMSEVEAVIDRVNEGADEKDKITEEMKEEFFNKFSKLNQEEFYELYERSDLIKRVYMLADSPKYTGGELQLHLTENKARNLMHTLLEEADILVNQVKK